MIFEVQVSSQKKRKFLESILPSIIEQLGLTSSKKSVLITMQKDCADAGVTVELPAINSYFIIINSKLSLIDVGITLAHEMVHVYQMSKGLLKSKKNSKVWRGKEYGNDTKYLSRPWEIQAYSRQELIFRRAIGE